MAGESAAERVLNNPYDNVYWLSRLLISSDKSSGIGGNSELYAQGSRNREKRAGSGQTRLKRSSWQTSVGWYVMSSQAPSVRDEELPPLSNPCAIPWMEKLVTLQDYEVLAFTCERILVPINNALARVPSNDSAFVASTAKALLEEKVRPAFL